MESYDRTYKIGAVKAIGVCNCFADRLADLICFNEIAPAVNQIECNVFYQRENDLQYMKKRGVQMEAGHLLPKVIMTFLITKYLNLLPINIRKQFHKLL